MQDGDVDSEGLALIDMFYQAALEPGTWPAALDGLNRRLDAEHSFLVINRGSDVAAPLIAKAGIDDSDVARLLSPEAARMLIPIMDRRSPTLAAGTALAGDQLMADAEFEQTEFYNEILRPMKRYYGLTVWGGSHNPWLQIAACRTRSKGPFLQPEARALERLFPHLTRAQQLHRKLRTADDRAAGLTAVIERLADTAIVLDAGVVCWSSTRVHAGSSISGTGSLKSQARCRPRPRPSPIGSSMPLRRPPRRRQIMGGD